MAGKAGEAIIRYYRKGAAMTYLAEELRRWEVFLEKLLTEDSPPKESEEGNDNG